VVGKGSDKRIGRSRFTPRERKPGGEEHQQAKDCHSNKHKYHQSWRQKIFLLSIERKILSGQGYQKWKQKTGGMRNNKSRQKKIEKKSSVYERRENQKFNEERKRKEFRTTKARVKEPRKGFYKHSSPGSVHTKSQRKGRKFWRGKQ